MSVLDTTQEAGITRTPDKDTERPATERLSVNISAATAKDLRHMAKSKAITVTEVIRRAVAVLKLLEEAQAEGAEIHLVRKGENTTRQLHLI
ncbi:hypothetical protein [Krasilnikovia sp. M28-CT-15]|uniref:hypothetical protein n=1 Tax=Krasilnikovia sp. M28-CT-15 TaxID=3373540 RepID=UPI0038768E03